MAKKPTTRTYDDVPGDPVKSFFVDMLTRDISLSDAILDLIDNCIDGILRKQKGKPRAKSQPYKGFYAHIKYDGATFEITDNCGGIPWALHEYAFRMGRSGPQRDAGIPTVGVYGIGMKRAIFKIGRNCLIQTQNETDAYDVEIEPNWLKDETNWRIPVRPSQSPMKEDGTTIVISTLNDGVKSLFTADKELFGKELRDKVATHYAFIINKGFSVKINDEDIQPRPTELRLEHVKSKATIRPFIYETTIGDVNVFMAIGFTHPIPSEAEVEVEHERKQYSSIDAGWTVVCNDRAVVYCDRSELTGWGEAGVPKYHTQFIAISGIVEFRSNDASQLPTTTTKRGIDASSRLYLQVKNKMREGLRMFTDFTNKWKGRELAQEAQDRIKNAKSMSFDELKTLSSTGKIRMRQVPTGTKGRQYKPNLPMPPQRAQKNKRITFTRDTKAVRDVADYLFNDATIDASTVGEKCFDIQLVEARK